jgi:hypothetical protein
MNEYTPDLWEVIRVKVGDNQIDKVIGSWYGGYSRSDSWRFSSGITKIVENDSHYDIHNYSGSVYRCYKDRQGMISFTAREFETIKKQIEQRGGSLEVLDIHTVLPQYV